MVSTTIAPERWEQLYRQEFARVYRALLAVLRDPDRALDALQDAFVAGLRKPPAEDDDLAGWLFVVAVRSGRRSFRRPFISLDRARSHVSKDEIEAALDRMEVGRLLDGLSERQRAMVVAQFYLGLDHREIARHFGVKTGTVSATLAQAKARMRAEVRNAS
jgi:RNA polymerase sigma-70 factor, ECF subfamily